MTDDADLRIQLGRIVDAIQGKAIRLELAGHPGLSDLLVASAQRIKEEIDLACPPPPSES